MKPLKSRLLSSTVVPVFLAAGVLSTGASAGPVFAGPKQVAANPCAAKNPCAARNPCNPCAARNPCNPCAARNPCNPCAARKPCNPCNPCAAASAASSNCVVPRLQRAAANPCNPCAVKRNPCNPCAARNPCNPCAAKPNPCNPCAARNPCNPCNPCAAAADVALTKEEAIAVYHCLLAEMQAGYAKAGNRVAGQFVKWPIHNNRPYASATHGGWFVNNYANAIARPTYRAYEKAGKMSVGGVLAKDSFTVTPQGAAAAGPLFLMEKMKAGFHAASGDWRYALIMPDGAVVGTTNGKGHANVKFCHECHISVAEDQDSMMFLPEEFRIN